MPTATQPEQRSVPLSAIQLTDGFNPRAGTERAEIGRLAKSVARHGLIQPMVVTATGEGEYRLIDGERRYHACVEASVTEVPVIVRSADDEGAALDVALVANIERLDLTPLEEAEALARLIDAGLTRKGVAERVGLSQKVVRERLQILDLPEEVRERVGDGTIPVGAVRALADLSQVHPELPVIAVRGVVEADGADSAYYYEPPTWADVTDDPIAHVASVVDRDSRLALPDGVYEAATSYPLERFSLSDKATRRLAELEELGRSISRASVWFDGEAVEAAEKLGAAHRSREGRVLIVGQDVADQLACDQIAAALKQAKAQAKARKQLLQSTDSSRERVGAEEATPAGPSEEELAETRRREREAQQEARRAAVALNDELGAAVVKHLAKSKVDARVVKILAAVDLGGQLDKIVMRGARYGMPGFESSEQLKNGKTKRTYLSSHEAGARARTFLANAGRSPGDLAGRALALIAMARYADEGAVAQSAGSVHTLSPGGDLPWSTETLDLIDELCAEALPGYPEPRAPSREPRDADRKRRVDLRANLDWLHEEEKGLGAMSEAQRGEVVIEAQERFGEYSQELYRLRAQIAKLENSERVEVEAETDGSPDDGGAA